MIEELKKQECYLKERVNKLEVISAEEQADVDRLEGRSLAAFFYYVIGKKDQQLDKERQEAYGARVMYDAAFQEWEAAKADLSRYEKEYEALQGCERQYEKTMKEKMAAVKATGGAESERILELEERLSFVQSQKKEIVEAIREGEAAWDITDRILESLDSAEGWGTWDLLGGDFLAGLEKHSHLDAAQEAVEQLQSRLRKFKTELSDVMIDADMQVNVEGFLRFADLFFDGLFLDWTVLNQISESQDQVQNVRNQISALLSRLKEKLSALEDEELEGKRKLDYLVLEARLS